MGTILTSLQTGERESNLRLHTPQPIQPTGKYQPFSGPGPSLPVQARLPGGFSQQPGSPGISGHNNPPVRLVGQSQIPPTCLQHTQSLVALCQE